MSDHATDWRTFLARFTRLGTLGFGGPPGHVLLMRQQWVETRVVPTDEFNDAFASVSLLPGPASTQLALWLGWRLRGYLGLLVAAFLFITPAVLLVLFFSWLTLGPGHPTALLAAALGAAAVVPAVALRAARDLFRSYSFPTLARGRQIRVAAYVALGTVTCVLSPPYLVLAIVGAGLVEIAVVRPFPGAPAMLGVGGATKGALCWMALKVGSLSFGGGFVIVPLMRGDAVTNHHWMTAATFAAVVAIGQLTPGPVVATVAGVGYAAGGVWTGLLAAAVAFAPSLLFVGVGARHLAALRSHQTARAFLDGAGPTATGAIIGSAILLARGCTLQWQWPLVALALVGVTIARKSPTLWLVGASIVGLGLEVLFSVAV